MIVVEIVISVVGIVFAISPIVVGMISDVTLLYKMSITVLCVPVLIVLVLVADFSIDILVVALDVIFVAYRNSGLPDFFFRGFSLR